MKSCYQHKLCVLLGALAAGVLFFILLATGVLTLEPASAIARSFFALAAAFSLLGGLVLPCAVLHGERTPALAYAWACCGCLAGAGAIGGLLTALGAFLVASSQILVNLGAALSVLFLTMMLSGLLCLAGKYATARFCCCGQREG